MKKKQTNKQKHRKGSLSKILIKRVQRKRRKQECKFQAKESRASKARKGSSWPNAAKRSNDKKYEEYTRAFYSKKMTEDLGKNSFC